MPCAIMRYMRVYEGYVVGASLSEPHVDRKASKRRP